MVTGGLMQNERRRSRLAVLCVVAASVCFSTGGLFMKLIPWSALAINGARNLIGAAVVGLFLLLTRHKPVMNKTVAVGALSLMGVTTTFALANKMTTAANAIVLQFTAPVFVILLMAVLYRQRPKRADVLTCAAVISGICYAGVFMMNTGKGADAISSSFWGQLISGVVLTPLCFRETDFSAPVLLAVLALGVVQVGGAYILFSLGIRHTPAVSASLITGLEPVLNPLWVALFYGETFTALSAVGAVIVVGSIVLYNVWNARQD